MAKQATVTLTKEEVEALQFAIHAAEKQWKEWLLEAQERQDKAPIVEMTLARIASRLEHTASAYHKLLMADISN
jgi:hypothetical protein